MKHARTLFYAVTLACGLAGRVAAAGVALAACLHEICLVYGRMRIARRQNVVRTVAAGTVRNDRRSQPRSKSVIALQVGRGFPCVETEFLREPHAFVTPRACGLRQVQA